MYRTIYVPVDNSEHSDRAVSLAVELGRTFESRLIGCHVYAARLHDYRFKQMEYTLPDQYLEENELERQRQIHDSLITMGLKLISDSYLVSMNRRCEEAGLEFEPRMIDGKNSTEILRDLESSDHDLIVMGALGLGRSRHSQIGSVCERVARHCSRDLLVVKQVPNGEAPEEDDVGDTVVVGIDGSPESFGALVTAIELAKRFAWKVEAVAVYDPYLHYTVFNGIVDVLTEKAAKVFRFEEQNQLHEEIIDTGLAQIYRSHLDVAGKVAAEQGVEIEKTLLDGKAFAKILDHVAKAKPRLLVLGRSGIHGVKGEHGLGSNTENLLRLAPCDVLLTTGVEHPSIDVQAEEAIRWTPEAEERFERVPPQVRGVARAAVHRLAVEKGHSVITQSVLDEAMERYMPKSTAKKATRLAEQLVLAAAENVAICNECGVAAADANVAKCSVCGGESFEIVTPERVAEILRAEGGGEEETTYDGRKLTWTQDARRALETLADRAQRRRARARIEKTARLRHAGTVTLELVREVVEEETGEPLALPDREEGGLSEPDGPSKTSEGRGPGAPSSPDDRKLIARDDQRNPFLSALDWSAEAVERILRVPPGFMRDRTQGRVEAIARERNRTTVDLELVEEAIERGREMMSRMAAEPPLNEVDVRPSPRAEPPGSGDREEPPRPRGK